MSDHAPIPRRVPGATYRLQFHAGFTFRDAAAIVPYLQALGVTDVYASPYLRAAPGSMHGYDVIDPCRLNPELGGEADYQAFLAALKQAGMSHILDTVPNHVGISTNENTWWNDVLENGRASRYGHYFDIAWEGSPRPQLHDKVLLPTLGNPYGKVLEAGELKVVFDPAAGTFSVAYFDRRFPLDPAGYELFLNEADQRLATLAASLPGRCETDAASIDRRDREAGQLKSSIAKLSAAQKKTIALAVEKLNRDLDALDALLDAQAYRLSFWQTASDEINYRRFFDINDLAAVAMEHEDVFDATTAFTLDLVRSGKVLGLRADHPDGLYDPAQYFRRLQERVPGLYVLAEKILAGDEPLVKDWPIAGTSGYDFLNVINSLFVDTRNEQAFTRIYQDWTGDRASFEELVYEKKCLILDISLASELQMLAHRLDHLAQQDRRWRDFTLSALRKGLREVVACFPVYRSYIDGPNPTEQDRKHTLAAIDEAKRRNPGWNDAAFDFIRDALLQKYPPRFNDAQKQEQLRFAGKFQQLTAPVTAKGIEDTTFYIYNRLTSLNEVGGEPQQFGRSPLDIHRYLLERSRDWPHAMSALSTHDTKRSEDVRARINVLSELADEWERHLRRWGDLNASHRTQAGGQSAPTRNEEYFIYQTLLGAWPQEMTGQDERRQFTQRIQAYLTKAMREAKVHTRWTAPNEAHESAVLSFAEQLIDENAGSAFQKSFLPFARRVHRAGLVNSLSQTLLRLTAPGVPDTYQGCELLDFSLVDPDNRRPVDYDKRQALLSAIQDRPQDILSDLPVAMSNSSAKLFLTARALQCRREHQHLFLDGAYLPLEAAGTRAEHVFAFARQHGNQIAVIIVPRRVASLMHESDAAPAMDAWGDTRILLPANLSSRKFTDALTGRSPAASLMLQDVLSSFPAALLIAD